MKNILTNNIGLKIVSIIAAILLWMVIVNVDDPVIERTYSGIQVEVINQEAVTDENKIYEITDGSDIISVTVSAERSVIENMSKDYIKATADLKQMTFMDTVPIEIKATRYSDRIKSLTSKSSNVQVNIENRKDKQIRVSISTKGELADGYVVGDITPNVSVISVSGPESVIDTVAEARIVINIDGMNDSFTNSVPVKIYGSDDEAVEDSMITVSQGEILTNVEILETKEIPITAEVSGNPAAGFSATGTIICEPSSIVVAGSGPEFENITSITIPESEVSLEGASNNVTNEVNIKKLLPKGIILADEEDTGVITVIALIEAHDTAQVLLPYSNITVDNIPDGYVATVLHDGDSMEVSISGLADNLQLLSDWVPSATVDGATLIPKPEEGQELSDESELFEGVNEGKVALVLPEGIFQTESPSVNINISRESDKKGN